MYLEEIKFPIDPQLQTNPIGFGLEFSNKQAGCHNDLLISINFRAEQKILLGLEINIIFVFYIRETLQYASYSCSKIKVSLKY